MPLLTMIKELKNSNGGCKWLFEQNTCPVLLHYMLNNYSISTNNTICENKTAIWASFNGSVYNGFVFSALS